MKTVNATSTIRLNEYQLKSSLASLNRVKQRLGYVELVLTSEPPPQEAQETAQWKEKLSTLFDERQKLPFPTLAEVKAKLDEEADMQSVAEETKMRALKTYSIPKKSIESLEKSREQKHFGPSTRFGQRAAGEIIREVHNYHGANSYHTDTRVLAIRDHLGSALGSTSGNPPWLGPAKYQNTDPALLRSTSESSIQAPFKSTTRRLTAIDGAHHHRGRRTAASWATTESSGPEISSPPNGNRAMSPYCRLSADSTMLQRSPLSANFLAPMNVTLGHKSRGGLSMEPAQSPSPGSPRRRETSAAKDAKAVEDFDSIIIESCRARSLQKKLRRTDSVTRSFPDYTMSALANQVKPRPRFEDFITEGDDDDESASVGSNSSAGRRRDPRDYRHQSAGMATWVNINPDAAPAPSLPAGGAAKRDGATTKTKTSHNGRRESVASSSSSVVTDDDFRVADIDDAMVESASTMQANKVVPLTAEEEAARTSIMTPGGGTVDKEHLRRFVENFKTHRAVASRRVRRKVIITATHPPLDVDIRPQIDHWLKEHEVYIPKKPHTAKYLSEHVSIEPVNVNGVLMDKNPCSPQDVEEFAADIGMDRALYSLPSESDVASRQASMKLLAKGMSQKSLGMSHKSTRQTTPQRW